MLKDHQKFSDFLQDVANDKDLGQTSDSDVNWIRMRFKNLKTENKKLKERKSHINNDMERIATEQRDTLNRMKKELFEKQKNVTVVQ